MYLPMHSFLHIHWAPSLVQLRRIGDGPAQVQPLVHLFLPQATRVNSLPEELHGINDDKDIMYQVEHHGGM